MELWPGSNIILDYYDLTNLKNMWGKNPREMVRRLLFMILGEDKLKKSTAKGKGGTEGIPTVVFNSVFSEYYT